MLDLFAQCADTHQPLVLDDALYNNQILTGPRRCDIRANPRRWRLHHPHLADVTEQCMPPSELPRRSRFRLLAENVGDVAMHVRGRNRLGFAVGGGRPSVLRRSTGSAKSLGHNPRGGPRRPREGATWLTDERAVIPRGRIAAADGTVHWVHVRTKAFYDADGRPDGYTSSFRVIDDEMRTMESAESARLKQANADALPPSDGQLTRRNVRSRRGRPIQVVNDAMCRIRRRGHAREELARTRGRRLWMPS